MKPNNGTTRIDGDAVSVTLDAFSDAEIFREAGRRSNERKRSHRGGRPITCSHPMGGDEEGQCQKCQRRNAVRRWRAKAKDADRAP